MGRPGQASLLFQELEHVGLAADVIHQAKLGVVFAKGLARSALHRPEDRFWEQIQPVTGVHAGAGQRLSQVNVGFFAG
jgi:hypothetical protein